jgi:hypothetical protein
MKLPNITKKSFTAHPGDLISIEEKERFKNYNLPLFACPSC